MFFWIAERRGQEFTRYGPYASRSQAEKYAEDSLDGAWEVVPIDTTDKWTAGRYIKEHLSEIFGSTLGTSRQKVNR